MVTVHIHHVGVYRDAQRHTQVADHVFLGLDVAGLRSQQGPGPRRDGSSIPAFTLLLAGETTEFEFGPERENWVIQLDSPDMAPDPRHAERVLLRYGKAWTDVPRIVAVGRERVHGWVSEMERIRECSASPLPHLRLRAELGVLNILRFMLDSRGESLARTPAQALRARIDEDPRMAQSLEALSRGIGYSPDYLRKLFEREYHVSPQEYRNRRRMALVMEQIANSRLSVKQIAESTGFRHLSHLSASFRAAFGMTPRAAIRQFRYGVGPTHP
jgi:AraC-like DNA-binding protein